MSFQKLLAFTKKVADFADKPSGTPAEIKAQFDAAPEELRQNVVNLIDALKSTATGDSGAKNLGATAITGLTGTDIQTIIEDLASKTYAAAPAPTFQLPTLFNGWVLNSNDSAIYWKDRDGIVHFHLTLKNGGTGINTVIMNFPTGFIPDREYIFIGYCEGGGVTDHTVMYHVSNIPAGELKLIRGIGGNSLLILSGSFKAVN